MSNTHLYYEAVGSFLEWSCQISDFITAASPFTYAKDWRIAVLEYTRSPVNSTIKMDMKNVHVSVDPSTLRISHSLNISFIVHYGVRLLLWQNEAVEYRDVELYAIRESEYPGGAKLGMLIQLRLLNGRRNRDNPSVPLTKIR